MSLTSTKGRHGVLQLVLAAVALVVAGSCMILFGCESPVAAGKTLTVGVRSDIIGFSSLNDKTGNYYGLEVDIAEEMSSRMGYSTVEYVSVDPDNRKEKLLNGEVDCLVACYSISDSRKENFDFSPSYYTDAIVAMVEDSSLITSTTDLKGSVIGTMSGANAAPQLAAKLAEDGITDGNVVSTNDDNTDVWFDNFHLLQFASYQELSEALEEGTVDVAVLDGSIAQTYMKDDRSLIEDFSISEQEYGVATQKDSELSAKVSEAIQGMLDDGTIASLVDKWD